VILATVEKSLLWIALTGAIAAFVSGLAWLFLVASKMSDEALDFSIFETILTATHFGKTWSLHLTMIFCFAACSVYCFAKKRVGISSWRLGWSQQRRWFPCRSLVMPAATTRPVIGIMVDSLHLLAASFWPAGLFPMAIYVARLRKSPESHAVASTMTERFSRMSLISVPILALTGLLNSWLITGRFFPFQSAYGRILLTKIIVFGMMVGIGAVNLWKIKPRFRYSPPGTRNVLTTLLLNVSMETCLACVVLILTGILGQTSPK
jgi:putative copper resistance protein D